MTQNQSKQSQGGVSTDSHRSSCSEPLLSVYVPGSDEYHPCKDREDAEKQLAGLRAIAGEYKDVIDPNGIKIVNWPFGAKSHAVGLKNRENAS